MLINMVASLDGKASANGKASGIGSRTDRTLMNSLRSRADAVMIGAGTLRAERLNLSVSEDLAQTRASRGLNPQPLAIVTTGSGDVPLKENLIGAYPDNTLVLASPKTPEERIATLSSQALVEILPDGEPLGGCHPNLPNALISLKESYDVHVLLVEGGPTLNHALIDGNLADELFLTLAPKLLGGEGPENPTILHGPPVTQIAEPNLLSVHLVGDELFFRYTLRQPRRPSRSSVGLA